MKIVAKPGPVALLLGGAFLISFSGVLVKTSHVSPSVSAFYRVFTGGLFLLPICIVKKEFKKKSLKNSMLGILCGLLFALDLGCWHLSIHYIGPGLATILGNFQVFVLSIAGVIFYKETLSLRFMLSVPTAFLGLFLLVGLDAHHLPEKYYLGVVLGLVTAVFYSMFLLLLRKLQSSSTEYSLVYYLVLLSFSCAVFLGGKAFFFGESFDIKDIQTWLSLITLGIMIQALAWILISSALPRVKPSHAGLILLLQPSCAFLWDVLFFDRQTGIMGWSGFFIVLIAIYSGMRHKL